MKFYKLLEIEEDDYIANTNDYAYDCCAQSLIKRDNEIYIAVNEETEDSISINIEDISETENSEEE